MDRSKLLKYYSKLRAHVYNELYKVDDKNPENYSGAYQEAHADELKNAYTADEVSTILESLTDIMDNLYAALDVDPDEALEINNFMRIEPENMII